MFADDEVLACKMSNAGNSRLNSFIFNRIMARPDKKVKLFDARAHIGINHST